ncbi:MAG: exodeoxyribonuclease VII large subunit [Methylobacteriaceae bacterium]|nr:exodeoxyribonuclease VII large subunit [Methylobacteriaceae bacterium]
MSDDDATNLAPLSVSELSGALKRTIEDRFGYVRVRGEVSGWRGPHSSGHCYFSLKDANARIDAVIWKGVFGRMKVRPEEGLEVIATGKITTFPGKSAYQIIVEQIELAGLGALMALLEQRRRKLAAEGLFVEARKQPLPFLPAVVGVVTSPTGAVIRDILHRLADRFPRRVIVWPVRVQGEGSAEEVAAAIRGFDALAPDGPIPRPDVLIVARGGGSLEDLWGFNEEIVVRAVADCTIPLIAAVGHETDWTLIDHAADVRAPTPTAAAERAVPVRLDLSARVGELGQRMLQALARLAQNRRREFAALTRALGSPDALLEAPRQALDRGVERIDAALVAALERRGARLARAEALLQRHTPQRELAGRSKAVAELARRLAEQAPAAGLRLRRREYVELARRLHESAGARLARRRDDSQAFAARLDAAFSAAARLALRTRCDRLTQRGGDLDRAQTAGLAVRARRLTASGQLLASLDYRRVLARGYVIVRDATQRPLRAAAQIAPGDALALEFADGVVTARAGAPPSPERPAEAAGPRPRPRRTGGPKEQGDLF